MTAVDILDRLGGRLDVERPTLDRYNRYYAGTQSVSFIPDEVREQVGSRLTELVLNWCRLVVTATEERLEVVGFAGDDDEGADADLWSIWTANQMDEQSELVHVDGLIFGRGYVSVWAGPDGAPSIRGESARQVIHEVNPATGATTAAIKRWVEGGRTRAVVYEPDRVTRFVSRTKVDNDADATHLPAGSWTTVEEIDNPLGVVPIVALVNRPRLGDTLGESELADLTGPVDAVAKLSTDLMVASEFAAAPRRWITGMTLPETDGEINESPFSQTAGRAWWSEKPETKFGQFPEATLDGFTSAIDQLTKAVASISSTPSHYLVGDQGQASSAEAMRASEAALIAKVRRRMRQFGAGWESVMNLAVQVRDGLPGDARLRCMWADPETQTAASAADAALKLRQLGVPLELVLERLEFTPSDIERARRLIRENSLTGLALEDFIPARSLPPSEVA